MYNLEMFLIYKNYYIHGNPYLKSIQVLLWNYEWYWLPPLQAKSVYDSEIVDSSGLYLID